jgi:hypothetical protein
MRLGKLIDAYRTDSVSGYQKLRYHVRRKQRTLLKRIKRRHGRTKLSKIKARTLLGWHAEWSEGGRLSNGHAFVKKLRTVFGFGLTILEDKQCKRLRVVMNAMRFPAAQPRKEQITAEQAEAVRVTAHEMGLHSIAMAQAFQFEVMLRQKDVIGEWVPKNEPGETDVFHKGLKWLRGLRGDEIDARMVLRHITSKRQKPIEVDLSEAPMILAEFGRFIGCLPAGPLIVCEHTGRAWKDDEFRRKWRIVANAAGIPKNVWNMDSRAGAISEAFEAGANPDDIRENATHSDLATTQRYNRRRSRRTNSSVTRARVENRRGEHAADNHHAAEA